MHGVPLTPVEVVNLVSRQVRQFEEVGLTHEGAIFMAAFTLKVEPYKIAALAQSEPPKREVPGA